MLRWHESLALTVDLCVVAKVVLAGLGGMLWTEILAQADTWPEMIDRWGISTVILFGVGFMLFTMISKAANFFDKYTEKYGEKIVTAFTEWMKHDGDARRQAAEAAVLAAERDRETLQHIRELTTKVVELRDLLHHTHLSGERHAQSGHGPTGTFVDTGPSAS